MIQGSYQRLEAGLHDKHAVGKNRIHFSNFLVTFNTNARIPRETVEAYTEPLYQAADALFAVPDNIGHFIQFHDLAGAWTPQWILNVKTLSRVEIGHMSRGSRLHLHVALKIKHRTMLNLNIPELYRSINAELERLGYPYKIEHIHVSAHRPTAEDYLNE